MLSLPRGFFGPGEVAYEATTSMILTRRDLLQGTSCRSMVEVDELLARLPEADLAEGRTFGGIAMVAAVDPGSQRGFLRVTLPAGVVIEQDMAGVSSAQSLLSELLGVDFEPPEVACA